MLFSFFCEWWLDGLKVARSLLALSPAVRAPSQSHREPNHPGAGWPTIHQHTKYSLASVKCSKNVSQ